MRTDFYNYLKNISKIVDRYKLNDQFEFELTEKQESKIVHHINKEEWSKLFNMLDGILNKKI